MACAPSEDSDQPGNAPSLIRVFAVRMKKAWALSYPVSAQRRLWPDWADAQADLSLRWAHMSFCWFCHEAAHIQVAHVIWFLYSSSWWPCWPMIYDFISLLVDVVKPIPTLHIKESTLLSWSYVYYSQNFHFGNIRIHANFCFIYSNVPSQDGKYSTPISSDRTNCPLPDVPTGEGVDKYGYLTPSHGDTITVDKYGYLLPSDEHAHAYTDLHDT